MDDSAMKLGLLLESAHAQQTLAEGTLEKLRSQVGELAGIAREEIRATLLEELNALGEDSRRAAETLRRLRYVADLRVALWTLAMAALACAGVKTSACGASVQADAPAANARITIQQRTRIRPNVTSWDRGCEGR